VLLKSPEKSGAGGVAVFFAVKRKSKMTGYRAKFPGFLKDAVQKNTFIKAWKEHEKARLFKVPVVFIWLN
jgi:hypothetical protein